jgi:MSHA biogenesis protein MshK
MVKPVNAGFWRFLGAVYCFWAMTVPAGAENLPDPTQPATPGSVTSGGAVVSSGPVLQSVMISTGRRVAVISGQAVKLGEKYGDLQVIRITESEVVLQGEGGTQTLRLYPGVEKKLTSRAEPRNDKRQR